ncbi:uncharacterized protein LOC110984815 isoform X2 [Acanthaster planci]|uniref:Uncharacterized protein LOC110984815 isoform X2 n=2 Tax=Acanthaster planci TaxID=133434 RepID=A0A8B7Z5Y1_ACAPL|nr:uncharacterized protein LOC110984815 isoform X2 [Acanthaster planci]
MGVIVRAKITFTEVEAIAVGDPHYYTFDGRHFTFQGYCEYLFASDCIADNSQFEVVVVNQQSSSSFQTAVTQSVRITIGDTVIQLQRGRQQLVNDIAINTPAFLGNDISIRRTGLQTSILTPLGLRVKWDGSTGVKVLLNGTTYGMMMCGLGGDNDGDPNDDFTSSSGSLSSLLAFANSYIANPTQCPETSTSIPSPCDSNSTVAAIGAMICNDIIRSDGPFAACAEANPTYASYFYSDCQYDVCASYPDTSQACDTIAAFVDTCNARGYPPSDWRSSSLCPIACPANSSYSTCSNDCELTCADYRRGNQLETACDELPCVEGCVCNNGYYQEGDSCVLPEECGCVYQGNYYNVNESFLMEGCENTCTCGTGGVTTCKPSNCSVNSVCQIINNAYTCVCTESYEGDGYTCERACEANQFKCPEGTCVPSEWICDAFPGDCNDFYDEDETLCCNIMNVTTHCPKPDYYRCPDGVYIPNSYLCDGIPYDCGNNMDESEEVCRGVCPYPGDLANGRVGPQKFQYRDGESIFFQCFSGYTRVGPNEIMCNNTIWSDDLPICYENCIIPVPPAHGFVDAIAFNHSDIIGFSCEAGYMLDPANATLACNNGQVNGTIPVCLDINECASAPCLNGGTCLNKVNAYECVCTSSWTGVNCETDVDECMVGLDTCHANAECTNTIGSFTCACSEGYRGDGFDCKEIILFPFGLENGDRSLRNINEVVDFEVVSQTFRPETGFPFGRLFYPGLYFMDNGLLILLNENDDKLGFPNPFPGGFTDINTVPMVAPFWADTDLSANQGDVFYQVYEPSASGTEARDAVLADASSRIRIQYAPSFFSFNATWMLVVTWYQLPSFIQQNETNTFQAALVTDGIYSFAIFNYREGEMLWDYETLASTDLIIGYNGGSGTYINAQLENPPFATRADAFRPDQNLGNTGLKGRWIYRLENNTDDTINPKGFCLDWYNRQPQPSTWDRFLGTCPCSFDQGRNDRSYGRRASSRGRVSSAASRAPGRFSQELLDQIEALEGQPFCLVTELSPSMNGAGMRCCYREDRSLILGYETDFLISVEERYLFNFQGEVSEYEPQLINWLLEDYFPRHYCCNAANDEAFCDRYFERRPAGSCNGYLPPNIGWTIGDPHIETLDGNAYTFNGLGEYVHITFPDGSGGTIFEVQGRTAQALDVQTQQLTRATIFTAFVAKANDAQKVQMTLNTDGSDVDLRVDDVLFNKTLFVDGKYNLNGTLQLSVQEVNGTSRYIAYWLNGMSINVGSVSGILDMVFSAPETFRDGSSRGLLGVWNNDPSDDFMRVDGMLQSPTGAGSSYTEADYFTFGESWRTTAATSLFYYEAGESWDTVNDETFMPLFLDDLIAAADPAYLTQAQTMCGSDNQCLYDALATNSLVLGVETMSQNQEFTNEAGDLANFPPNITGPNILQAVVGEQVTLTTTSFDPEGQSITFSLTENILNGSIDQNGVFAWNPQNLNKVRVGIRAFDGETNSVLEPTVKLCDCQNGGTCMYDQYTENSNVVVDKFAVVVCACTLAWTGDFCETDRNGCEDDPCFPGITCVDALAPLEGNTCGPCPDGLEGDGFKCYDLDECTQPGGSPCEQICNNILGGFRCSCETGYELHPDARTCLDIDECDLQTDNCHEFATCANTAGSFTCTCSEGFSDTNGDGTLCEDIDECFNEVPVCDTNSECTNTVGSYSCICDTGYEKISGVCQDINECTRGLQNCSSLATCTNSPGSYFCTCNSGFEGDGRDCQNIDECMLAIRPCHPRAVCEDNFGSYVCVCNPGQIGDGIMCMDVDECLANTDDCAAGTAMCTNTQGSYECRCYEGYTGDGFMCEDIDECTINATICSVNAKCQNTPGSYDCTCKDGYIGNGAECYDMNECTEEVDTCNDTLGLCINTIGSYTCRCVVGYEGDGRTCTNIDECTANTDDCEQICTDTIGSFVCSCRSGFTVDMTATNLCQDIDECSLAIDNCTQGCNNTVGSFECFCFDGFRKDNQGTCVPDSVCISKICTNGDCYVLNGMELCACYDGYKLDGSNDTLCINIDECTDMQYPDACDQICIDAIPGYTCDCNTGYRLTTGGRLCEDINECIEGTSTCDAVSENCFNTDGSFVCNCKSGFVTNGTICSDINECEGVNLCSANAACTNLPGTYSCTCLSGYSGDGQTCVDINECASSSLNDCSVNSVCTNLPGSYRCDCLTGFEFNGTVCNDIDECVVGHNCSALAMCVNTPGSYQCPCLSGYEGDGAVCIDVNECTLSSTDARADDCHADATCTNTEGGYLCACNSGYSGNGTSCTDVNECNIPDSCAANSTCDNTPGDYVCTCNEGFSGDARVQCFDIDECLDSPCDNNAQCSNSIGSYTCTCHNGYVGTGFNCTDVNECASDDTNDCHPLSTCINVDGSFTCRCRDGYVTSDGFSPGRECEDVNECAFETDTCDPVKEVCINNFGSFTCMCGNGYEGTVGACTDVNECENNPCESQVNTRCQNLAGTYRCLCQTGFFEFFGVCTAGVSKTVYALFTDIVGFEVNDLYFNYNDTTIYQIPLSADLDAHFNASMLRDYQSVFVNSITMAGQVARVIMTLTFLPNSSVSDMEIIDAFVSRLTGRDNNVILPDSRVFNTSFGVGDPIINPCEEGTFQCPENAVCVFNGISNEHTCMCADGWSGSGNETCIDVDECLTAPCTGRGEMCVNSPGSYSCDCRAMDGFQRVGGMCVLFITYDGRFTVYEVNRIAGDAQYLPALGDPTSPEFLDLSLRVCGVIRYTILLERSLQNSYYDCQVINFTMADQGTEAEFLILFIDNVMTSGSELQQLVMNQLDSNNVIVSGTTTLGNLTLAPSSIVITDINPACTDTYCLNGGTCENAGDFRRNCTCPEGYAGSRCEIAPTTEVPITQPVTTQAVTPATVPTEPPDIATTGLPQTTAAPGGGLTTLQIIGIALGLAAFVLLIILMCLCMLVMVRRRQAEARRRADYFQAPSDRMKIFYNPPLGATRISEYRGYLQPDEYLGVDNESVSDDSSFIASLGQRSEEESRMRHLANVITQSPYLNERMRARISSMVSQEPPRLPQSEFVRPYIATGREAAEVEVHRDPEDQPPRRPTTRLPERQTSFRIPRAQFYWDSNTESFS